MHKPKKYTKKYGTPWLDTERREGKRYEADEEEDGVSLVISLGRHSSVEGGGVLVNIGEDGAFIKAELPPGTALWQQSHVAFKVTAEGRLCNFSAEAHILFKKDERVPRMVGKEGKVDLNLRFFMVDKDSEHTLQRWMGYGDAARPVVGRRRRKWK
ncbi:MAG: PilZ domain-containing protein [bacterium]|nr:PilZ domain-containing protein [bacterium]